MESSTLWIILSFSFLMALTGALSPGPLFTYTIIKSIQTKKRGYLVGFWIILGHSLLEMAIIVALLAGFSYILAGPTAVRIIGVIGGTLLIFLGSSLLFDIWKNKVPTDFLDDIRNSAPDEQKSLSFQQSQPLNAESTSLEQNGGQINGTKIVQNPVVGGILVSMSNPYWWAWWATIGIAVMIKFDISFATTGPLLAFFIGHELGDLSWYFLVSIMVFFGRRAFNKKIYYTILASCGFFMICFGLYLGISPFIN